MRDLNSISITGRLGNDPEIRYGASGNPNTTYNVAISDDYKAKDGGWISRTYWITVKEWRENNRLAKGDMVAIKGKLVSYKGTDNKTYYNVDAEQVIRLAASNNPQAQPANGAAPVNRGASVNNNTPAPNQGYQQPPTTNQSTPPDPPNLSESYDDGVPF